MNTNNLLLENKKAKFNYFIEEKISCGIVLKGTEVKSIKAKKLSFNNSFASIKKEELWLENLHVSKYKEGNIFNHDELRPRKLLIKKRELQRLKKFKEKEGYTLIPISFYLKKSIIKVEVGICKGKKLYDKREILKQKSIKKDLSREIKYK
ncbi:SsrA-binding protein SmpB [Borreliella burgdorferi]|uniref:SsrA-binding protein n=3 Tax=Borreliella burgdorferi TaxID=139 RepID=SSRP_BORBU|nr:SsrA-binding protein SmpB [Borreliella burgdorferi]O51064.1 RecName: Full=SsrA-binding protein; AltName: Full=Small protein B [Borreliella burgdorferi B31]AGS66060.1 SsrA-binding protein [Borreliella burgdorferi CA382]EOA80493.1 SsrA-binding protein [Borreliella burgdorferi CA8]AAC66420.1 SsrA-binding protein [Borreliella burgdorferi B31]ACK74730.1 SsrA-binding protein [Borreliella burgdorferi ZS7]ADQ29523.1 SsrA-binding protein [Borreliella burgdorferi N40]